jgi:hypothetical protein
MGINFKLSHLIVRALMCDMNSFTVQNAEDDKFLAQFEDINLQYICFCSYLCYVAGK